MIGSKTSSSSTANGVSQVVNGSSSRPSSNGSKLSGYFQRSSSATSSGFGRASNTNSLSRIGLNGNGGINQRPPPLPPSVLPSDLCPSCLMPFDKNRKRRLIDFCGHERCYACLFSSELCPLCSPGNPRVSCFFHRVCYTFPFIPSVFIGGENIVIQYHPWRPVSHESLDRVESGYRSSQESQSVLATAISFTVI